MVVAAAAAVMVEEEEVEGRDVEGGAAVDVSIVAAFPSKPRSFLDGTCRPGCEFQEKNPRAFLRQPHRPSGGK